MKFQIGQPVKGVRTYSGLTEGWVLGEDAGWAYILQPESFQVWLYGVYNLEAIPGRDVPEETAVVLLHSLIIRQYQKLLPPLLEPPNSDIPEHTEDDIPALLTSMLDTYLINQLYPSGNNILSDSRFPIQNDT